MAQPTSPTLLSRRRLLTASGATLALGSAGVLAACGPPADERNEAGDIDQLNEVLASQLALAALLKKTPGGAAAGPLALALTELSGDTDDGVAKLEDAIDQLGGNPTKTPGDRAAAAESAVESLRNQLQLALTDANSAVGELSTAELRDLVYDIVFTDAANAALMNDTLGDDVAPDAFVGVPGGKPAG